MRRSYRELHRLAQHHLSKGGGAITLSATTLLHEAYLDMSRREHLAFPERNSFMAYASRAMRGLVIDYCRSRRAQKRGGDITFVSIDDVAPPAEGSGAFEQLDLALQELEVLDPLLVQLVDLKFFCGSTRIAHNRGTDYRVADAASLAGGGCRRSHAHCRLPSAHTPDRAPELIRVVYELLPRSCSLRSTPSTRCGLWVPSG